MTDALVDLLAEALTPLVRRLVAEEVDQTLVVKLAGFAQAPDQWMTTDQAAAYLRLSREALRARARRGTIPSHRDGDRWLYSRAEIDAFIRDGRCR